MDVALALISLELKDIEKPNKLSDDLHISYEREGGGERDRKSSGRKADSRGKEKWFVLKSILDVTMEQVSRYFKWCCQSYRIAW